MCPEFELLDRQVANDVSPFEAIDPSVPAGRYIFDARRAIKKFRRSAAGNYELAEDLRPPQVLLATTCYLMSNVLSQQWPSTLSFAAVYGFVRDRLRAIRTDLTLQSCRDEFAVRCHELAVRFIIAAGHLLSEEERAAFAPQQNCEQLNGSLSALRELYKTTQRGSRNEAEMQSFAILLGLDKREAASAIASIPEEVLASPQVQVALDVYRAFQQSNHVRFFKILQKDPRLSYLQACLMHQFVLPMRQRALTALAQLNENLFFDWFRKQLCFVDDVEVEYYAGRFGFTLNASSRMIDLYGIRERGEAIDLRAEEQNFRFRRFDAIIEGSRRAGKSLSNVVFGGKDRPADYDKLIQCLKTPNWIEPESNTLPTNLTPPSVLTNPLISQPQTNPAFDHQMALKKKLEAQAAQRQKRKELIAAVAENLWEALVEHTVRFNVAELSTKALERVCKESQSRLVAKHSGTAEAILNELLNEVVKEQLTGFVELSTLRVRAFEALSIKADQHATLPFIILNALEREICDEFVKEAFLECKAAQFLQRKILKKMRQLASTQKPISSWKRLIHFDVEPFAIELATAIQPVHLLFLVDGTDSFALEAAKSLLSPLSAAAPVNELAYLQTFLPEQLKIQMLSSYQEGPLILSRFVSDCSIVDFFSWPPNYPAPTHIFVLGSELSVQNIESIPWRVNIFADWARFPRYSNGRFKIPKEVLESLFSNLPLEVLLVVDFDLLPSQLIPSEIFEIFIKAPDTFTIEHVVALFSVCCSILWESSTGQRVLVWHPQTAGRSAVLETLQKAPQLPSYFERLMQGDLEQAFQALDDIIGPCLVACREILFTNQSLSMIQIALSLEESK